MRGNYSTYEQELHAAMLALVVLSSQSRPKGCYPVARLWDQEPLHTFHTGPPPEKAKLRCRSAYLSQLPISEHHIQGVKNEFADYIGGSNFDNLIGDKSEELAKEAFNRVDV